MRYLSIPVITAVSTFAIAQVASAADLPLGPPPPVAAPAYDWTGFYVGGNAGYSWGTTNINFSEAPAGLFGFGFSACRFGCSIPSFMEPKGFIGGPQLGFNYQTGMWVWGVEGDFAWRNPQTSLVTVMDGTFADTLTLRVKQESVGTVRGRLGVTQGAASNWLMYVTGGLAYGKFDHSVTQFCNVFCNETVTFSDTKTKAGWTLGGGVELALNWNLSIGFEYLYVDFGTDVLNSAGNGADIPATSVSFHDTSNVMRFKANYKF